jgi:transposase
LALVLHHDEQAERYSTQECSVCHARTGPKGRSELNVRQRACSVCSTKHDRDTNAAKNILARGLAFLEISVAGEAWTLGFAKAVEAAVNEVAGTCATAGVGHGPLNAGIPSQVASRNL